GALGVRRVGSAIRLPRSLSCIPRPPRSALFPYTTLFRSQSTFRRADLRQRARRESLAPAQGDLECGDLEWSARVTKEMFLRPTQDRKSTRLNSSHVKISYAVFCLKKKNKRRNIGRSARST